MSCSDDHKTVRTVSHVYSKKIISYHAVTIVVRTLFVIVTMACVRMAFAQPQAEIKDKSVSRRTPDVQLWLDIPKTFGLWEIKIVNHDTIPVRVLADARKLMLLVRGVGHEVYERCELPEAMRGPDSERMLVLQPGQIYRETIDPRLYCWGTMANRLTQGASVTAFLGWPEHVNKRVVRKTKQPVSNPPFALEPVLAPAVFLPQKYMVSLTNWLTEHDVVRADPPVQQQPAKFVGAADLRLTVSRWSDALDQRNALIETKLENVGDREALVHVRPDDLYLQITRPDGTEAVCSSASPYRAAVRDFFTTIKPGKSKSISSLLSVICPAEVINRPGLYQILATLRLKESGKAFQLQAQTGDFSAQKTILLRLRQAKMSFYKTAPNPAKTSTMQEVPKRKTNNQ